MLPVKIGIYAVAVAIEETEKQLCIVLCTLVYDNYLHLDVAQCKSGKHTDAWFKANIKRQVLE